MWIIRCAYYALCILYIHGVCFGFHQLQRYTSVSRAALIEITTQYSLIFENASSLGGQETEVDPLMAHMTSLLHEYLSTLDLFALHPNHPHHPHRQPTPTHPIIKHTYICAPHGTRLMDVVC
jgi:hypothetical protein